MCVCVNGLNLGRRHTRDFELALEFSTRKYLCFLERIVFYESDRFFFYCIYFICKNKKKK